MFAGLAKRAGLAASAAKVEKQKEEDRKRALEEEEARRLASEAAAIKDLEREQEEARNHESGTDGSTFDAKRKFFPVMPTDVGGGDGGNTGDGAEEHSPRNGDGTDGHHRTDSGEARAAVGASGQPSDGPTLESNDVKQRLRILGQPATLFGEDDNDRYQRYVDLSVRLETGAVALSLVGKATKKRTAGPGGNMFDLYSPGLRKDVEERVLELGRTTEEVIQLLTIEKNAYVSRLQSELDELEAEESRRRAAVHASEEKGSADLTADEAHAEECSYVLFALKKAMLEWKIHTFSHTYHQLVDGPARHAITLIKATEQNIAPLSRQLRRKTLDPAMARHYVNVWTLAEQRNYTKAEEAYFDLSIGNSPWIVGVVASSMHARRARERIEMGNVKHILNNEVVKAYLHATKRLLRNSRELHGDRTGGASPAPET